MRTGDVYALPLIPKLGYGYVRFIKAKDFEANPLVSLLIQPFGFCSKEIISSISILDGIGQLTGELLLVGSIPKSGEGKWVKIGNIKLPSNYAIPHFKDCYRFSIEIEDEEKIPFWEVVVGTDVDNRVKVPYHQLKHLEIYEQKSADLIAKRISMELLRKKNLKLEDYFDVTDSVVKAEIRAVNRSIPYYELEENLKGKAF